MSSRRLQDMSPRRLEDQQMFAGYILKINNNRYHALKPNKDKYIILKGTLKVFTHKELTDFLLNKVSH